MRHDLMLLVFLCLPSPAWAWNALGHKVIAEIAWRQLKPEQRKAIVEVLRHHPRFDKDFVAKMDDKALTGDKAVEDEWIFQQAATWPDIIRKNPEFDHPTWHYVDFPIYLNPSDEQAMAGKLPVNLAADYPTKLPPEKWNVLQALAHCQEVIRGKAGAAEKAVAYCWIMHLVGDLHQPLHSTALFSVKRFPEGDRGGNDIPLVRGKNLHALCDDLLGRQYYFREVTKAVAELSNRTKFSREWDSAAQVSDPIQWAHESHGICRMLVYHDAILNAVKNTPTNVELAPIALPDAYYQAAGTEARRRVVAAGVRLGDVLDRLAKGSQPVETTDSTK